ncbi:alkaline phosphatase D family protein [Methylocucumis oryzae]|uniref:alkaline phosphatase D family protein n=1 Tax=Methylocucumis oryzae TaxID=1632867 RepID=UPI000695E4B6|nr:alkaline phosphatase D family protein [Methylocucumis oryzae]
MTNTSLITLGVLLALAQPVFAKLPNGIASGDTTATSTVLWARSSLAGNVRFQVKDAETVVTDQQVVVTQPLIPAKLAVTGLSAGKTYSYTVTDPKGQSLTGSFKTAPAGGQVGLSFGVSGDWRGELAPYPALKNAIAKSSDQNLDFFIKLGDTIYADHESPAVPKGSAETLRQFRLKHNEVYGRHLGRNTFANLQQQVSIFSTIDDHEVRNDFSGGALASACACFPETTGLVNQTKLYQNGLRAFFDYNAIANTYYPAIGDELTDGRPNLYRVQRYGTTAGVFILDARSFRDDELDGVSDISNATQIGTFIANSFDATTETTRTMLGQRQLAQLKVDLLHAQADNVVWKFIAVPEPIQNLGVLAASDRFEGYASERSEILRFIDENKIKNVVFVSADIHGTIINDLTYQRREDVLNALATSGNPLAAPHYQTSAFEITTGSVAYEPAFGDAVLGLLGQVPNGNVLLAQLFAIVGVSDMAGFNALPMAVKNETLKSVINLQLTNLGYTPIGLQDNPKIDATFDANANATAALFSFGWSRFDIDAETQALTITTYGIPTYTAEELAANPAEIIKRKPSVLSKFTVHAQL